MTTVTLTLPDQTMALAQQAAAMLQQPVEKLLSDILLATLPKVQDAPADMQAELMHMAWLDNQELWRLARRQMAVEAQTQLQQLLQLQEHRPLTPQEQEQIDTLRRAYGRVTLLKARAYALLSLRGGEPLLSQV